LAASNAANGFYKVFYGDLWGKFLDKKLYIDLYAHHAQTGAGNGTIQAQSNDMYKVFASYNTGKYLVLGAEAYTQNFVNGFTNPTTKVTKNGSAEALSFWLRGAIVSDKLGWFARYDTYNPYSDYDGTVSAYTVNTNYSNFNATAVAVKETFITAGLDFTPAPKIHFSPNLWLINYKDQRNASTAGYFNKEHTLVARATFYYTFGK
jgi:hypothetical protein